MAKSHARYVCQSCGSVHSKWSGRCDDCGAWNTLSEEAGSTITPKGLSQGKGHSLAWESLQGKAEQAPRTSTGIGELDRVLGGGLVNGSAVLIGGDPGIGKSTILLQAAVMIAQKNLQVAYISGEESVAQVQLRASRLQVAQGPVMLSSATSVRDIAASLDVPNPPHLVIIDSIQTMFVDNIDAAPGTVSQVRAAAHELIKIAKKRGFAMFLVGHVTKDGQIAGPRVLEHMVDTVLYFEGERGHPFRILRSVKNRFGGTDEIGVFEMTGEGLREVANPSALFLSGRQHDASGSAVFAGIEGSRPLLVEMQALVVPSFMSNPRRSVVGWDTARLSMVLAVLEARAGVRFSDKEIYLNVAGGMRITDPAADLAAAAAILSALSDQPAPAKSIFFGEIALSGEARRANRSDARLKEAEKLGFERAYFPHETAPKNLTIGIKTIDSVQHLVAMFKPSAKASQRPAMQVESHD